MEWLEGSLHGDGYGDGYGSGSGYGYGDGYGDGYGSGSGYGYGDGYGDGYGFGYDDGSGSGYGDGDGYGDGYGSGSGYGYGDGYGDGYGSGSGYGDGYGDGYGSGSGYGYESQSYWMQILKDKLGDNLDFIPAFWRSNSDGTPSNGGRMKPANIGDIQEVAGPLQICSDRALHGTLMPPKWVGDRLWIVAMYPPFQFDGDKIASLKRKILMEVT